MGGESGRNAESPGRNREGRQSEASIYWRMPVVEEYERSERDKGEREKRSS